MSEIIVQYHQKYYHHLHFDCADLILSSLLYHFDPYHQLLILLSLQLDSDVTLLIDHKIYEDISLTYIHEKVLPLNALEIISKFIIS